LTRELLARIAGAGGFSAVAALWLMTASGAGLEHGRWLAFTAPIDGSYELWRIAIADGRLERLTSRESGGEVGCHLALSPDGRYLVVAHYGSGSVSSFAVDNGARLSERLDLMTFDGSGPVAERQDRSRAHQVVFAGGEILVPDLGTDRVHRLALDADGRFRTRGRADRAARGIGTAAPGADRGLPGRRVRTVGRVVAGPTRRRRRLERGAASSGLGGGFR